MSDFTNVAHYQPPFVRLTQVGQPSVSDGVPVVCYVDPTMIMLVARGWGGFAPPQSASDELKSAYLKSHCEHTSIWLKGGGGISVVEPPEIVHMLRERALGRDVRPGVV